jgi:deoxyribodipyrimidine photolyase-related protein
MRHFRDELRARGLTVDYQEFSDPDAHDSFLTLFRRAISTHSPQRIVLLEPGRSDILHLFSDLASEAGVELTVLDDPHFLLSRSDFTVWADGRRALVAETFYRMMRRRTGYLMEGDRPAGGTWNYDRQNRKSFTAAEPPSAAPPLRFHPDETTRRVCRQLAESFPELIGSNEDFGWPVTPDEAREALNDFIANRLVNFGTYQDAMWTGEQWLYHSAISTSLNLRMIDPREVVEAAIAAYEQDAAPLNAVEGLIRQIIGWREFIRGIYWLKADKLHEGNALNAVEDLPALFWSGDTSMHCLSDLVGQLLDTGYAHHIQRLMVAGLFCQLYGVDPRQVHDWFMALYVDSVEWVTLPNTVGMSQYADGGTVGTKPYIASGKYIDRMSNYCQACRFDPGLSTGDEACPFTTLYWDFIRRHRTTLETNGRTLLQVRNYQRKGDEERDAILRRANRVRELIAEGEL